MTVIVSKLLIRNTPNKFNGRSSERAQPLLFLTTRTCNNELASQFITCLNSYIDAFITHETGKNEVVVIPLLSNRTFGQPDSRV